MRAFGTAVLVLVLFITLSVAPKNGQTDGNEKEPKQEKQEDPSPRKRAANRQQIQRPQQLPPLPKDDGVQGEGEEEQQRPRKRAVYRSGLPKPPVGTPARPSGATPWSVPLLARWKEARDTRGVFIILAFVQPAPCIGPDDLRCWTISVDRVLKGRCNLLQRSQVLSLSSLDLLPLSSQPPPDVTGEHFFLYPRNSLFLMAVHFPASGAKLHIWKDLVVKDRFGSLRLHSHPFFQLFSTQSDGFKSKLQVAAMSEQELEAYMMQIGKEKVVNTPIIAIGCTFERSTPRQQESTERTVLEHVSKAALNWHNQALPLLKKELMRLGFQAHDCQHVLKTIANAYVTINIKVSDLEVIFESGQYKSSFERNPGKYQAGMTDARKCGEIYKPFGLKLPDERDNKDDISPADIGLWNSQPRFGALNLGAGLLGGATAYGSCNIVLKHSIKQFSTLVPADSIYGNPSDFVESIGVWDNEFNTHGPLLAQVLLTKLTKIKGPFTKDESRTKYISHLLKFNPDAINDFVETWAGEVWTIMEVHVFNRILLGDIEEFRFDFAEVFGSKLGRKLLRLQSFDRHLTFVWDNTEGFRWPFGPRDDESRILLREFWNSAELRRFKDPEWRPDEEFYAELVNKLAPALVIGNKYIK